MVTIITVPRPPFFYMAGKKVVAVAGEAGNILKQNGVDFILHQNGTDKLLTQAS